MKPEQETMSVEEFHAALDSISVDVLASHLILMEELRAIREEVYDPEKEAARFFSQRQEAGRLLLLEKKRQSEIVHSVLARAKASRH